jgi:hypothetical protein
MMEFRMEAWVDLVGCQRLNQVPVIGVGFLFGILVAEDTEPGRSDSSWHCWKGGRGDPGSCSNCFLFL